MISRKQLLFGLLLSVGSKLSWGQSASEHIASTADALRPYGVVRTSACNNTVIDFNGPFAAFALPDGTNPEKPGDFTWTVLQINVLRMWLDFTNLDEDRISGTNLFSLGAIAEHKRTGSPPKPDTPAVFVRTKGLNGEINVKTVDLARLAKDEGKSNITEADAGIKSESQRSALFVFIDQEHADAFKRSLLKAIVACKAESLRQTAAK